MKATEERDPDSREAIRLRDAGVRVINLGEFERRWVTKPGQNEWRVKALAKQRRLNPQAYRGRMRTGTTPIP